MKNNKAEQLDNLFLEPNLIILIFVISRWLLTWMKAFGGEPKGQVPRGNGSSASTGSAPAPPRRMAGRALPVPSTEGCHVSDINSPSRPQAACVYNQLLATLYPLASREYFASTYVPLLLFLKMDLNQDASRNEDEMSLFTEESKKYSLGKMQ